MRVKKKIIEKCSIIDHTSWKRATAKMRVELGNQPKQKLLVFTHHKTSKIAKHQSEPHQHQKDAIRCRTRWR